MGLDLESDATFGILRGMRGLKIHGACHAAWISNHFFTRVSCQATQPNGLHDHFEVTMKMPNIAVFGD